MFVGVDAGTSVTKAVAFDPGGRMRAVESIPTRVTSPRDGWFEQDPDEVVESVVEVVRRVVDAAGEPPTAIGITGQGDGVWLVDGDGRPTRPAVSWMDARGTAILERWTAEGLVEWAYRRTGNLMFPGCPAPVLAWLDAHEPETLDRTRTAGYCKDVVLQRLTGVRATDASDASLPFLDQRTGEYARDLLDRCGLAHRAGLLAPVVNPYPVGELAADPADALGIAAGTPITGGPFDLVASALGSGVVEPGEGHLIVGTTLGCQVLVDTVDVAGEPAGMTLATGGGSTWLRSMPAMAGTAALDWVLTLVRQPHDRLDATLAETPPGARGVRCLPYFSPAGERAPFLAPKARARFDGIDVQTSDADLVRAVCEAIAYAARHCFDAAGLIGDVAACGGGIRSTTWAQIFADVLNKPVRVPRIAEIGAYGAALAACSVTGFDTGSWSVPQDVFVPDTERAAHYAEGYLAYRAAVEEARTGWAEK